MAKEVRLKAHAKLNLGLRIINRRPDGYHELESLFTRVSIYDEITIAEAPSRDSVTFEVNGAIVDIQDNTVLKALGIFRKLVKTTPYLSIHVKKNIPMGAGLGGGSADAGYLFRHLQKTYASQTSENELIALSAKVGADVPFFTSGAGAAFVSGVGEVVTPVQIEKVNVVIIRPGFGISTPMAYKWFDEMHPELIRPGGRTPETHTQSGASRLTHLASDVTSKISSGTLGVVQIVSLMTNDLEKPVESRHPEISEMKKALRTRGALASLMSGSGSSVYGIYKSFDEARTAREKLQQEFPSPCTVFICETT